MELVPRSVSLSLIFEQKPDFLEVNVETKRKVFPMVKSRNNLIVLFFLPLLQIFAGCIPVKQDSRIAEPSLDNIVVYEEASNSVEKAAHELATQMAATLKSENLASKTILSTNFVNLDGLECSSALGRYLAEELSGRLQRRGVLIKEARRGITLRFKKASGEYLLTRDVKRLAGQIHCDLILTGTYLTHGNMISINSKIISVEDNKIVASGSKVVPIDPYISGLARPDEPECAHEPPGIAIRDFDDLP